MSGRRRIGIAVVALAALAAIAPRPETLVEQLYSRGVYPALQAALTTASNTVPFAVFDLVLVVAIAFVVRAWGRALLALARQRRLAPLGRALVETVVLVSAGYLWFLLAWGLNYSRPPIETRLRLPVLSPTGADVIALLDESVAAVNAGFVAAHAPMTPPMPEEATLASTLAAVDARLGRPRPTVPGLVKPTLLASYFRMAGVDGLTAPAMLETLLNPDLLDVERPFTLAHEWAHLSGAAPEADASFIAWLVTMAPEADARAHYSGWLFLVSETANQVPPAERRRALAALGEGPRADLAAIARRQSQRVDLVERVGWRVYDSYLKSQGVTEGVRSYSRVVELIVRARRGGVVPAPTLPPPVVPQ